MTIEDRLHEVDPAASTPQSRFARSGRLAPFPGAPDAEQVRCSCDRCGTHLLSAISADGRVDGSCPVCLSRQVTPLPDPRATA